MKSADNLSELIKYSGKLSNVLDNIHSKMRPRISTKQCPVTLVINIDHIKFKFEKFLARFKSLKLKCYEDGQYLEDYQTFRLSF